MKKHLIGLSLLLFLAPSGFALAADDQHLPETIPAAIRDRIHEPVDYTETLIVTTKQGVAVFVFDEATERGRHYHYRALLKGSDTEITGKGELFEKYAEHPTDKPNTTYLEDMGSALMHEAGPFKPELEWSYSDEYSGYIYFFKPQVQVTRGNPADFAELDLKKLLK